MKRKLKKMVALMLAGLLCLQPPMGVVQSRANVWGNTAVTTEEMGDMLIGSEDDDIGYEDDYIGFEDELATASNAVYGEVVYNTGDCDVRVAPHGTQHSFIFHHFDEEGNFEIFLPDENPFFPYEIQFKYRDVVKTEWFMTPTSVVEVDGHRFSLALQNPNEYTSLSLNAGGRIVTVYPEKKIFENKANIQLASLTIRDIPTQTLVIDDLYGLTPLQLTNVSINQLFMGGQLVDPHSVVFNTDSAYGERRLHQKASTGDKIDLSYGMTDAYNEYVRWEMVVGDGVQLSPSNRRYFIDLKVKPAKHWLKVKVYNQLEDGSRVELSGVQSEYDDDSSLDYVERSKLSGINYIIRELNIQKFKKTMFTDNKKVFYSFELDPEFAQDLGEVKFFEGTYRNGQFVKANDITDKLWNVDMSQTDNGYLLKTWDDLTSRYLDDYYILMETTLGGEVYSLPIWLGFLKGVEYFRPELELWDGSETAVDNVREGKIDDVFQVGYTLYKEFSAETEKSLRLGYQSRNDVTNAYVGDFNSIAEANAAGAVNIVNDLRGSGYSANYANGILFTFFSGPDGEEQQVWKYHIKAKNGSKIKKTAEYHYLNSSTNVYFHGLYTSDGNYVPNVFFINRDMDSYSNFVTILVDEDVDLRHLAFRFSTSNGVKLYATGSSTPEVSKQSFHDFSEGLMQFTAASEDGQYQENFWVQFIKRNINNGLYLTSFKDSNAKTRVENGITYSKREVFLDREHDYVHDILLINTNNTPIENLHAILESDVVELDGYWTADGRFPLDSFSALPASNERTNNMAILRIKGKEGQNGKDIRGKLSIKSGETLLAVLELTGQVGDAIITTESIPNATKYVPYGTVLQNNNKYKWRHYLYEKSSGRLPIGMEIRNNGEIYGVPKESGEFKFGVRMYSRGGRSSYKDFTLVVKENSDSNVESATDTGYNLKTRVPNIAQTDTEADYLLVSNGEYGEYTDIFLDGERLVPGVDYTSESGSTRITLLAQTLKRNGNGKHTLGIEFRAGGEKVLKRAAQNYNVAATRSSGSSGSSSGSGRSSGGSNNRAKQANTNTQSGVIGATSAPSTQNITHRTLTEGVWEKKEDGYYFLRDAQKKEYWSGWIVYNRRWFYLDEQGKIKMGWQNIGGKWYYFYTGEGEMQGSLQTGWFQVDGKWYYLKPDDNAEMGVRLESATTPDGYKVGEDGVWIV